MNIEIRVAEQAPPVGSVSVDGGPGLAFAGWLGLLGILAELLGAPVGLDAAPHGLRGDLDP